MFMSHDISSRRAYLGDELLEGPALRLLLRLAAPTVAVVVTQTIASIIETHWIGRLGTNALAGAALVIPMVVLMSTMSSGGIGGGVSSAVARAIGAGDRPEAERLLWHSIWLALFCGSAITLSMHFAGRALFTAMGGRGEALEQALTYAQWMFASSIPMWGVNLIAAALRGAGDPVKPARIALSGSLLSAILTPLFIFGVGPFPEMGVAGVGAAIGIYNVTALALLLRHLVSGKGALTLRFSAIELGPFKTILKVGLAAAVNTIFTNVMVMAVTGAVGKSGPAALAGFGIAARLDMMLIPPLFGLGTAVVALVGAAVGAGRYDRARQIAFTGALLAAVAAEVIGLVVAFAPTAWTGLFTHDRAVAGVAATYLQTVAPFYGALGFGILLYFAAQGTGRLGWPIWAGFARLAIAASGAWFAVYLNARIEWIFAAVALGTVVYGGLNWFGHRSEVSLQNVDGRAKPTSMRC